MILVNPGLSVRDVVSLNDRIELSVESRALRRFIVLPELAEGIHELRFNTFEVANKLETTMLPAEQELKVWPVPSNGPVRVFWRDDRLSLPVAGVLYNLQGREVLRFDWQPRNHQVNEIVPLEGLASGTYLLHVSHPGMGDLQQIRRLLLIK